jgi:hypothetical protein
MDVSWRQKSKMPQSSQSLVLNLTENRANVMGKATDGRQLLDLIKEEMQPYLGRHS